MTDVLSPRIVRSVGEPERDIAAPEAARNFDAVENMVERLLSDGGVRIPQRSVFVDLVLEHVGVDGAGAEAMLGCEGLNVGHAFHSLGKLPQYMQGDGGTDARPAMHMAVLAASL